MFYEYALEPAVLSSWDRTRFFLDAFGPWKGRFLAEYPRHWKKMVFTGLGCPDVEKKKIMERLVQLDKRVFSARANAPYNGAETWIENAEREHARLAFHAIIAAGPSDKPQVLDGGAIDELDARWRVETGRLVPRDPAEFVRASLLLLNASSHVVIVDPHFRADQYEKRLPLVAFCNCVRGRASVEVHCSDRDQSYAKVMSDAARALPRNLPAGMKVTLHCWKDSDTGRRFHNRYLLTEVGGIKFGDGIEVGGKDEEDHLSILDEPSRIALWNQYLGTPPAFEPAGDPQEFVGDVTQRDC